MDRDTDELRRRFASMRNHQLLRVVGSEASDYRPEALRIAREELERRGVTKIPAPVVRKATQQPPSLWLPPLRTINGCGFGIYGSYVPPAFDGVRFKMVWLSLLWVPVLPLGIFLVEPLGKDDEFYGSYRFVARAPLVSFAKRYGVHGLASLLGSVIGSAILKVVVVVVALLLVTLLFRVCRGV